MNNTFIAIPSIRHHLANDAKICLGPLPVHIVDGTGFGSFSKLINHCIVKAYEAGKNNLVIVADRYRPRPPDVESLLSKIEAGYALVCPGQFGFFGFSLDFIRTVGFMDERYGGGFEDTDMMIRCASHRLALYEAREIKNEKFNSSWNSGESRGHFERKWRREGNTYVRLLPEERYDYDIGRFRGTEFLDWSHSKTIFPDLAALQFETKLWKSRARPTWTYAELWDKFLCLTRYQGRRYWNRMLRWHYRRKNV